MNLVAFGFLPHLQAQQPTFEISLAATQYEIDRLAPGANSGQAVFVLDTSDIVVIHIVANIENLDTSVEGPSGVVLDQTTISTVGGEFVTFEGGDREGPLIIEPSTPGFHHVFMFPSLGVGEYVVHFSANLGPSDDEVAVITEVVIDSSVGVSLIATEPLLVLGNTAVLTALVFDGTRPVIGASVNVVVQPANGSAINLNLMDDGSGPDDSVGDGLYSGEFIPSGVDRFDAVATIAGLSFSGTPFTREAAAEFHVIEPSATLTGSLSDQGVDDNGNGLHDRLVISVGIATQVEGDYRVFVQLLTPQRQGISETAEETLTFGNGVIQVSFDGDSIRALGEDGPYDITLVDLVFLGPEGAVPGDQLLEPGKTQAFSLSDFDRPELSLTGNTTGIGVDNDGNGRFDLLGVNIEIDVLIAGSYSWTLKLTDQDRNEIAFSSNSGFLSSGLNNIGVFFDGLAIGDSRTDGPYLLRDLLVSGPASLVSPEVGQTPPFTASQFESSNLPPDCSAVTATPGVIWPVNHKFRTISISGIIDPDGDPIVITTDSIFQDEAVREPGDGSGNTTPDGEGVGTDTPAVRAERNGSGNGRVYHIAFSAEDVNGAACSHTVTVCVPHNQNSAATCVDEGPLYDSTTP